MKNLSGMSKFIQASLVIGSVLSFIGCDRQRVAQPEGETTAKKHGCFECHGSSGISQHPNFPNLASQKTQYIINQLETFRRSGIPNSGVNPIRKRYNLMMNAKAAELSDTEITLLARYFSQRPCDFFNSPISLPPPEKVRVCSQCHGENGISQQQDIPSLAGQKQLYLENQLWAFRATTKFNAPGEQRGGRYHKLMTVQAAELSDKDITELTSYYSSLNCRNSRGVN